MEGVKHIRLVVDDGTSIYEIAKIVSTDIPTSWALPDLMDDMLVFVFNREAAHEG